MHAVVHNPPTDIDAAKLPPGSWIVLNEERKIAISGDSAQSVIEEARRQRIDLTECPVNQTAMELDSQVLNVSE